MSAYRKKPVVIEAVQYEGEGNMAANSGVPDWLWDALEQGVAAMTNGGDPMVIHTLEGDYVCSPGDWIIRGVKGELYPCKPDIFEATYDTVDSALPQAQTSDQIQVQIFTRIHEGMRIALAVPSAPVMNVHDTIFKIQRIRPNGTVILKKIHSLSEEKKR